MKANLFLLLLPLLALSATGQKLVVTAGCTRVGEASFSGGAGAGLRLEFPVGRHLVSGLGLGGARNHQPYRDFVSAPLGVGGRTITEYHNRLYFLQTFLAAHLPVKARLQTALGLSAGRYLLNARERSDASKWGLGIWSAATYPIQDSHFSLEAVFNPRWLLPGAPAEDSNYRFGDYSQFIWDAHVGISYRLHATSTL